MANRFSSSRCYDALSVNNSYLHGHKLIWCTLAAPKHIFMFWLAVQDKLLINDGLTTFIWGLIFCALFAVLMKRATTTCFLNVPSLKWLLQVWRNGLMIGVLPSTLIIGINGTAISATTVFKIVSSWLFYNQLSTRSGSITILVYFILCLCLYIIVIPKYSFQLGTSSVCIERESKVLEI